MSVSDPKPAEFDWRRLRDFTDSAAREEFQELPIGERMRYWRLAFPSDPTATDAALDAASESGEDAIRHQDGIRRGMMSPLRAPKKLGR